MTSDRKADALLGDVFVWDGHAGIIPDPNTSLECLELWRGSGVNHLSINIGFDVLPWQNAIKTAAAFRHWIDIHPDSYVMASGVQDIRKAKHEGRMSVSFDLEGMNALDGSVEMIGLYHELGVRQILFAYNRNNAAGGGCHDDDQGLTDFGRRAIDEMNRLGIFVDVSHCGYRTSMEAMQRSGMPVIFSHSNARALWDHERNIWDDQIKACAETGGLIGVNGVCQFLGDDGAGVPELANHIDHIVSLVGPDRVGISLDYTLDLVSSDLTEMIERNADYWPVEKGYDKQLTFISPRQIGDLAEILLQRGYKETEIAGVLGGNFLALAERVWRR